MPSETNTYVEYARYLNSLYLNNPYSNGFRILGCQESSSINNAPTYIKSYNYVPNFNMNKIGSEEELYLGAEIEVDNGGESDNIAKEVIEILGDNNVYCKHDGSLSKGFEIVTHPATYEYHQSCAYEKAFNYLIKNNYKAHETSTCGLHIHFNRNYFGNDKLIQDLCISELLYLFEKFWDKVVLIARRDSNHYANRFYLNNDDTILDLYAKSKNANKYGAINLCHDKTVEIRIYKGTLRYQTFMNTLEFTRIMVKLVKETDIYNIQNITWENILNHCSERLKDYIKEREDKVKEEIELKQKIENTLNSYNNDIHNYTWSVDFSSLSREVSNMANIIDSN